MSETTRIQFKNRKSQQGSGSPVIGGWLLFVVAGDCLMFNYVFIMLLLQLKEVDDIRAGSDHQQISTES
ncbi:hypothetical protein MHI32_06160 [Paenibacillus sp. FSL H7-0690]|jgi:hypothetical protein|uniref:hypothetical protein n=1 Tax=unclassified Paenibacillus TaxID=185978 RepID=UPI0030ED898B